jgi:hypothetical protein
LDRGLPYSIYGLSVKSDVTLAGVPTCETAGEPAYVAIRSGDAKHRTFGTSEWFASCPQSDGSTWLRCARTADGYLLSYPGLADFDVDSLGANIIYHRSATEVSDLTISHLLLDHVLPLVSNLRGREALHATAVMTPSGVFAFLGVAGIGKSTLAANFLKAGYVPLCDDCLALEELAGEFAVYPGYPALRLWEDSLRLLGDRADRIHRIADYTNKSSYAFDERAESFTHEPLRLARIYSLNRLPASSPDSVSQSKVEPLGGGEALAEVLEAAFRLDIEDKAMLGRQFEFFSRLVRRVPVRRLWMSDDLAMLDDARETILRDQDSG